MPKPVPYTKFNEMRDELLEARERIKELSDALAWIVRNKPFDQPNGGDVEWYAEQCYYRAEKALDGDG